MKASLLTILLFGAALLPVSAEDFYVAPDGNDAWSGQRAEPNLEKTDGPFATLERARDAVRNRKAGAPPAQPVTVFLSGGTYRVEATIEFTPSDSGTEQAPVTYRALPRDRPIISGGRPITGWKRGPGSLWQTLVPRVKDKPWYFHQLFVNGSRRTRARSPNVGYYYTADVLAPFDRATWMKSDTPARHGFYFRDDDIRPWQNLQDALIVVYHAWTSSIHFITALDPVNRTVRLAPPSAWPIGYWWEFHTRYHVENIFEALDAPGEWYLDRATGTLSYWPMPGEDMRRAEVVAPLVSQTLIAFKGQPAAGQFVEHLRFEGIAFHHVDPVLSPDMPVDQQGAVERQSLIEAVGLRHALFLDCEIAHAGENGLRLDSGCSDNIIRRCQFADLGGGAVFIGPRVYRESAEQLVQNNVVDNCFIHHGSNIFRGSQGVWIGQSSHNEVTHNEVSDFQHVGISIGRSWGYAPSTAHHNLIAFNHVHHICNGCFSDGGGIYTLGVSPGTVIRNNVIHDVVPTPLMPIGGNGIYLDEGSTSIVVEDNIVHHVGAGAFIQNYGRENVVRNNIFAFAGREPIACVRAEDHLSFTFEGNIVLCDAGQAISSYFSPRRCGTEFHHNLYWDTSGREPLFSGVSFAAWQGTGRDRDSLIADPEFYNASSGDFRLRPTSPALAMGFRPIATSAVGLYGDRSWVIRPAAVSHAPVPNLPPPPPRLLVEDFESLTTGLQPALFRCVPPDRPDLIQVTDEAAAAGRKSLKFTKVAGLPQGWMPHLYYNARPYTAGRIRFSCDILIPPAHGGECGVELRDYTHSGVEYLAGPAVRLRADGTLLAAGRPLITTPLGRWVHLDIQFDLGGPGRAASKGYQLAVSVADQAEQVFADLPYHNAGFRQLTWFGFSSLGKADSVFYVDNLRLEGGM